MRRFHCQSCTQEVFFENDACGACRAPLGFDPDALDMVAPTETLRRCANFEQAGCNWLVRDGSGFCGACRHNRTIPDLNVAGNVALWRTFEAAKRRLFYGLIGLKLPLRTRAQDPAHGLAFDCIDDVTLPNGDAKRAMTGHDTGVITIAMAEADPSRREYARVQFAEPYRTLLGHLRHEIGHYYWDILVRDDAERLAACRSLFGDDRADYAQALQALYAHGPAADWRQHFISAYAASHPWEDFAESWAHYMHIVDTLETAQAFEVAVQANLHPSGRARVPFNAYEERNIDRLLAVWTPLTIAINCMNRSMGQPDIYPFVLPTQAIFKFEFICAMAAIGARPQPKRGGGLARMKRLFGGRAA